MFVLQDCTPPEGFGPAPGDCDDANPNLNPGIPEICDGIDNDCNGEIDDGLEFLDYYPDMDGDTYGDAGAIPESSCSPIIGFVTNGLDCNDSNPWINPDQPEVCDLVDNNCDGNVDEGFSSAIYYLDADGDGYGEASHQISYCVQPDFYVTNDLDCDDNNPNVNPAAAEICDGLDNNCDGNVDEGFSSDTYYLDNDGDGYGDPMESFFTCAPDENMVLDNTDCDDGSPNSYPGAPEICDGLDNNCDGQIDVDK